MNEGIRRLLLLVLFFIGSVILVADIWHTARENMAWVSLHPGESVETVTVDEMPREIHCGDSGLYQNRFVPRDGRPRYERVSLLLKRYSLGMLYNGRLAILYCTAQK